MGAQDYGALCKRRAEELGISQNLLASRLMRAFTLDEDEERTFDSTAVRLIYHGGRKIDHKLFRQLNKILDIDQDEAEFTLGIWPSGFDLAEYRRLRELAASELTNQLVEMPYDPQIVELIDRNRRRHPTLRLVGALEPAA